MTRHPSQPTPERDGRDWIDTAIELASGATAAAMFAYGVALSYSVLHAIALAAGLPRWSARLWPLGFEAFMASAALNALAEQRHRRQLPEWHQRVPWYPWTLTGLTAGASILLNWLHPAIPLDPPPSWLVSLVYGLPPLAAVFAWHLFLQRIAHHRRASAPEAGTVTGEATTPAPTGTAEPADRRGPGPDAKPAEPTPVPLPMPAAVPASKGSAAPRSRGTGTATRPADVAGEAAVRARARALFDADPQISGAALGRAVGRSDSYGRRLRREFAAEQIPPPVTAPGSPGATGNGTAGPAAAGTVPFGPVATAAGSAAGDGSGARGEGVAADG
jgi:hypothetical protein